MNKRQRGKSQYSHEAIALKVGVSRRRIGAMLNNPDSGQNRARLTAALIEMGLNETAAKRFIDGQNSEQ